MNLTTELRRLLKDAGTPLSLDQIMDQVSTSADRHAVSARLGAMKKAGELATSIEEGKVAYAWTAKPAPRRTDTVIERIRALLREATRPMTTAEVCMALPGEKPGSVQSLLSQYARAGEFQASTVDGGRKAAYSIAKRGNAGNVSVAVNVGNVTTAAPAPAPAAAPTPAPAPHHLRGAPAPAPAPAAPSAPAPSVYAGGRASLGSLLDHAVLRAQMALEAYIRSVGDVDVYRALQAAVDAARAARAPLGKSS